MVASLQSFVKRWRRINKVLTPDEDETKEEDEGEDADEAPIEWD